MIILGLWTYTTQLIQFTLMIDDFEVKYVGKDHAKHQISVLQEFYAITRDWTGGNTSASHSNRTTNKNGSLVHAGICLTGTNTIQSLHINKVTRLAVSTHTTKVQCKDTICTDAN